MSIQLRVSHHCKFPFAPDIWLIMDSFCYLPASGIYYSGLYIHFGSSESWSSMDFDLYAVLETCLSLKEKIDAKFACLF